MVTLISPRQFNLTPGLKPVVFAALILFCAFFPPSIFAKIIQADRAFLRLGQKIYFEAELKSNLRELKDYNCSDLPSFVAHAEILIFPQFMNFLKQMHNSHVDLGHFNIEGKGHSRPSEKSQNLDGPISFSAWQKYQLLFRFLMLQKLQLHFQESGQMNPSILGPTTKALRGQKVQPKGDKADNRELNCRGGGFTGSEATKVEYIIRERFSLSDELKSGWGQTTQKVETLFQSASSLSLEKIEQEVAPQIQEAWGQQLNNRQIELQFLRQFFTNIYGQYPHFIYEK